MARNGYDNYTEEITETENTVEGITKKSKKKTVRNRFSIRTTGEDDFIKLYLKHIGVISELPKGCPAVLFELLQYMTYAEEGQTIFLNSEIKKRIAEKLKITVDRINHTITDFVKKKIFFRLATGTYAVNPTLFGRGTWNNIKKLRLTINYDASGVNLETKITKQNQSKHTFEEEVRIPAKFFGDTDNFLSLCK